MRILVLKFIITLQNVLKSSVIWLKASNICTFIDKTTAFQISDNCFIMIKASQLDHTIEYVNQHRSVFFSIHKIIYKGSGLIRSCKNLVIETFFSILSTQNQKVITALQM